jgi:2,4-diketo-3-deoxy-L-fuconate hydrolase
MKICRFDDNRIGVVSGQEVRDVTAVLDELPRMRYPFPCHDLLVEALPELRGKMLACASSMPGIPLDQIQLRSPVANPGKLFAAPVNYQAHLDEAIADPATFSRVHVRKIQETGLFLKATSSLIGSSETISIAHPDRRTDHEVELAVVIGRLCRNITPATAHAHIAGYCVGLDITVRGPEERSLRKSLDTYSVLGPWLTTADEISHPITLDLWLDVNGERRQMANTRDLIMNVPELISFASAFYTLHPGDVLYSGTPEGVGAIKPGDRIHAEIESLGSLQMRVDRAAQ